MKRVCWSLFASILFLSASCSAVPQQPQPATPTSLEATAPDVQPGASTNTPILTTPTLPPMASLDDEQFDQRLAQSVESLDFENLRSLMKDRFSIAIWNTELREVPAQEALDFLTGTFFAPGAVPAVKFDTDVVTLLDGTDPLSLWGPVANPVRAMHVTGLGEKATDEAVLVIGRDQTSGQLYWHGILLPVGGFFQSFPEQLGDFPVPDGTTIMVKQDLITRAGPGTDFPVIGQISAGQTAQVTAKSADGNWWKIYCTGDLSNFCYVSADPSLTELTAVP